MHSERSLAFVGLGEMGGPIASHFVDAGFDTHGYNRTPERAAWLFERGMSRAGTPREAASAAPIVFVSIFDDAALRAVTEGEDGLLAGLAPGDIVVETSTVHPATSAALAELVADRGAKLLRAPVSGNGGVARAGQLTFLCSGDRDAYDTCAELFELPGKASYYLGEAEQARVAKLALNLMIAASMQMVAEALGLTEKAGIERGAMLELMKSSAIGSPFVAYKAAPLVEDDYTPTFPVRAMRKDLSLAFEVAGELSVPLPTSGLIDQLLAACEASGWGELDFAALFLLERTMSGVAPES